MKKVIIFTFSFYILFFSPTNLQSAEEKTPLMQAIFDGDNPKIKRLVDERSTDINTNYGGVPPLIVAIRLRSSSQRSKERIESLLKHPDIDLDLCDSKGRTAYDVALEKKYFDLIDLLENHEKDMSPKKSRKKRKRSQKPSVNDYSPAKKIKLTKREKRLSKPYPCPYDGCDRSFYSADFLDKHETGSHGKEEDKSLIQDLQCPSTSCNKLFHTAEQLTLHVNRDHFCSAKHFGRFPCLYPSCGKLFYTQQCMKKHELTHRKVFLK